MTHKGNGWTEYQQLVLDKLESHGEQIKKLDTRLWILVACYLPTLIFAILQYVMDLTDAAYSTDSPVHPLGLFQAIWPY